MGDTVIQCVTLREETEWMEAVEAGWNLVVVADTEKILDAVKNFRPKGDRPPFFGDGKRAKG